MPARKRVKRSKPRAAAKRKRSGGGGGRDQATEIKEALLDFGAQLAYQKHRMAAIQRRFKDPPHEYDYKHQKWGYQTKENIERDYNDARKQADFASEQIRKLVLMRQMGGQQ